MLFRYLCYLLLNAFVNGDNNTVYEKNDLRVNDVANELISTLGIDNQRIQELKNKIEMIGVYVINRDKYADYLMNELNSTNLSETNFFNSLNESDSYKFLSDGELKNLYLKMKEKMNRDDILKILSDRVENSTLVKSARKTMQNDQIGKRDLDDIAIDNIIDKFIGQKPKDNHKFDYKIEDKEEWDPQSELDDLNEYHRHDGRRIFKGQRTTIKYYPFMVSIHIMGRFWCGGVIYSSDLVLTSAACLQLMHNNRFFRENPGALIVRVGSNHSRIGGEKISALEVYFHPGYSPKTLRDNIAVIRLTRHLFFTKHRVPKRIDISHNDQGLSSTSEVLVLGWGVTQITQKMLYEPIFLNRKILPVYPNVFCKEVYGEKFITSKMFCAGTFTTGEGACDHDAGGPAILAGKLVGIISFGSAMCGHPNTPTVFTLVGAYVDWIETVNETMPEYYRSKVSTTTFDPFEFDIRSTHHGSTSDFGPTATGQVITPISNNSAMTDIFLREGKESGWSIELRR